ncbi:hypothetical protein B0A49_02889 [Cryomyces minteri]|uniref:MARVEL domain-containing protein n=1 Tax=Cryomyces minteri TaxID=331657 RepID=A0A4U0XFR6_9PEZI|nr:hypothetical protein B0A49_05749 [Cryomyces minteri]TKA75752.1 hypothetical protein B0A49_02889 [Cryomyces minteri]
MALGGVFFILWRIAEILTLIPVVGMLSYFVHGFVASNQLTPNYILVLFIASVLAAAWAVATLIGYARARHSGLFVALVDLAFVGTLIAAVYELRGLGNASCGNFGTVTNPLYVSLGPFGYYGAQANSPYAADVSKTCGMLKACFALGIMNIILFFFTFLLALLVHRHHRDDAREVAVKRETSHASRHSHRRSSRDRGSRERSRRPSSHGRREHHSSNRRQYYV